MSEDDEKIGFIEGLGLSFDRLVIGEVSDSFFGEKEMEGHISQKYELNNSEALDRLDAKASAMLTHISMMVATGAFIANRAGTNKLELIIITSEIVIYLFLALCCLRVIVYQDLIKPKPTGSGKGVTADGIFFEVPARYAVNKAAAYVGFINKWLFFITFIFAITLLGHVLI